MSEPGYILSSGDVERLRQCLDKCEHPTTVHPVIRRRGNTPSMRSRAIFATILEDYDDGTYNVEDEFGVEHDGIEAYTMQGVSLFEGQGDDASNKYVLIQQHNDGTWYIIHWRPLRTV